jgi:predicted transposase YdaD
MNMLMTEWNWDDAKQVWFEDGLVVGRENEREEIARNALAKGVSLELIHDITSLDIETLKAMKAKD